MGVTLLRTLCAEPTTTPIHHCPSLQLCLTPPHLSSVSCLFIFPSFLPHIFHHSTEHSHLSPSPFLSLSLSQLVQTPRAQRTYFSINVTTSGPKIYAANMLGVPCLTPTHHLFLLSDTFAFFCTVTYLCLIF